VRLFNSMSRTKEELVAGPIVNIYVCGVTPYDTTHLGHAFSYATFDILIRYLKYLGHAVRYTQNVTDIDDDILRRSKQVGIPWDQLGREQTAQYVTDMAALNIAAPTHFPLATDEIPSMVDMISTLLDRGHAYQVGGAVYFSSRTAAGFGDLARLSRRQMLDRFAETGDSPDNPDKRDALDFILWKPSTPGEPSWDSPWGPGRPGWHIECSAMAVHYLGPRIDIHGGGDDLLFPHHSCEIAQSENATGKAPFARFWMHNAPVRLEGTKMSKSLGNLVMARELLTRFNANAIRLYLLRHHYRTAFDYDEQELLSAARDETVLRTCADAWTGSGGQHPAADEVPHSIQDIRRRFVAALADDLDTPAAAHALMELTNTDKKAAATIVELAAIAGMQF
jgi:L-cysteine:1D-myo-inositol 2-amino-2-deoxy-alpha-D-glucopyranoside ligase